MGTVKVLVGCREDGCADEVSYPLDMVKFLDGEPICENCYGELPSSEQDGDWSGLPPVTLSDLCV